MTLVFLRRVPSASGLCLSARQWPGASWPASIEFDIDAASDGVVKREQTRSRSRRHAETWTGSGCPPLPRAPRRPEQLSKWPQERAALKLVL